MINEIISYITKNRVSSTEIADCLGKKGVIPNSHAVNSGHFKVGKIHWVYAYGETNWHVHQQIQQLDENDIVFVEAFNCKERAIFGDIVSKYILLYQQAHAIVTTANLRDAPRLIKENWPIWCGGFNPVGCFNRSLEHDLAPAIVKEHRTKYHGAIAVCDDTGVVVIPKEQHNQDFLDKLVFIEAQEDIWYECIDRKKWSTFDTICLKKYLNNK